MDRQTETPVPLYGLFGETPASLAEAMVHCETIESRSRGHGWEISPHRHVGACQLLLVFHGQVTVTLAREHSLLDAPAIVTVPSGVPHGFRFSEDVDGVVVTLAGDWVHRFAEDDEARTLIETATIARPSPPLLVQLRMAAAQLLAAGGWQPHRERLRGAIAETLLRLAADEAVVRGRPHADELVARFEGLVDRHYRSEHGLDFYAAALHCTRRTLSRRVHKALGVTPLACLHQRLVIEATRMLRFTNASAASVAAALGFADPSFFSRFYARETGRRPREMRAPRG